MEIIQEIVKITVVIIASYVLAIMTAMYTYYETYNKMALIRIIHMAYTIICSAYLIIMQRPVLALLSLLAIYPPITPILQAVAYTVPQGLIMVPLSFTAATLWHLGKHEA